jgi:hypothetical protein
MPNFKQLHLDELKILIQQTKFTRKITQIHIHHTWKPTRKQYTGSNGIQLQESMREHHVLVNKWADIGQHLTLLPDGSWVTGRDFNMTPASIQGWNEGAFAIEVMGNFDSQSLVGKLFNGVVVESNDQGYDVLDGAQLDSLVKFCVFLLDFFKLNSDAIKFHRESPGANKTCPGTTVDKVKFLEYITAATPKPKPYEDWDDVEDWAKPAVEKLKELGLMSGYKGNFSPLKQITRQEVAQVVFNLLKFLGRV